MRKTPGEFNSVILDCLRRPDMTPQSSYRLISAPPLPSHRSCLTVFSARVPSFDERKRDAGLRRNAFTSVPLQKTREMQREVCSRPGVRGEGSGGGQNMFVEQR
jgi:hypothetical protein